MELSQLFSKGSKLSDVPPDFNGMPGREWQAKQLAAQCDSRRYVEAKRATLPDGEVTRRDFNTKEGYEEFLRKFPGKTTPLLQKRVMNPRDLYGMKGLLA